MVVAQSGGPSPVHQSTACAELLTCARTNVGNRRRLRRPPRHRRHFDKGNCVDLSAQTAEEISLLQFTPAAGSIGTCRYKLKPAQTEDFNRTIDVLKAHDIGYFLLHLR